jgi:hypothetical protein
MKRGAIDKAQSCLMFAFCGYFNRDYGLGFCAMADASRFCALFDTVVC